jgi:hypothetical protein
MPNSDYHRRQADMLMHFAETITDSGAARHLRSMAADNIALADQYAVFSLQSDSDRPAPDKAT